MAARSGKTAPRLLEDLLNYSPALERLIGRNVLTSAPPQRDLYKNVADVLPDDTCRHVFVQKQDAVEQALPVLDSRPGVDSVYTVRAICLRCRSHLELTVDYTGFDRNLASPYATGFSPCPNTEYPLHHFQYASETSRERRRSITGPLRTAQPRSEEDAHDNIFQFKCSAPDCQARVYILLRKPLFCDRNIHLLTDRELLKRRLARAKVIDPDRIDFRLARPADALDALTQYLRDGMDVNREKRQIPIRNKRYMTTFGEDGAELLESLGFTTHRDLSDSDGYCHIPQPKDHTDPEAFIMYLKDVREELFVLLANQPESERETLKAAPVAPVPVINYLKRCLSCQGHDTVGRTRALAHNLTADDAAYVGLGACADFTDELINFAFDRQVKCDPTNTSYYIDCLADLVTKRNQSDTLAMTLAVLRSEGQYGTRDVEAAYRYFGLDKNQGPVYDETYICGTFRSRIQDLGPSAHAEARENLRLIGEHLNSRKIIDTASTELETYPQALQYLDIDASQSDENVQVMYGMKATENTENAQRALGIIAQHRNSTFLTEFLRQVQTGDAAMDVAEAYRILEIQDRSEFDMSTLDILLGARISEAPHREAEFEKAATVLRASADSATATGAMENSFMLTRPAAAWPVGIQNLGNTCYLNSLLQFYFTVKPFRNLLINFEQYKQPIDASDLNKKQVSGLKIAAKEVRRCQELAQPLGLLFQHMIDADSSSVKPTLKLASAALIKVDKDIEKEAILRRRSTIGGNRPIGLGMIDGAPVSGPLPPISAAAEEQPTRSTTLSPDSQARNGTDDAASDITLVGDILTPPSDDEEMKDASYPSKQLRSASPDTLMPDLASEKDAGLTDDARSQAPGANAVAPQNIQAQAVEERAPPARAPPIPPRPTPADPSDSELRQVEEAARQQDVMEVILNVMFQIECAIKPEGIFDESGEQSDIIKRIFYGKIKWNYEAETKQLKTEDKIEGLSIIPLNIARKPANLMAAMDDAFDLQYVDLSNQRIPRFVTAEHLPPVLQIFINRTTWDYEKRQPGKLEYALPFDETIYMDRYMSGDPKLVERRKKTWDWKKQLRILEAHRAQLVETSIPGSNASEVVRSAADVIFEMASERPFPLVDDTEDDQLAVDPSLADTLRDRSRELGERLTELDMRIKGLKVSIEHEFEGYEQHAYRLHAIFIHRGFAGAGHYWIYIRDFQRGKWLKYNDEYVTEETDFSLEKIYNTDTTPAATPYFLVYVKEGLEDELVQSLCRRPPESGVNLPLADPPQVIEGIEV